jgi:hypothetical protein
MVTEIVDERYRASRRSVDEGASLAVADLESKQARPALSAWRAVFLLN